MLDLSILTLDYIDRPDHTRAIPFTGELPMMFYLNVLNACGVIAVIVLPIIACVNVCCFGQLNVTRETYVGRWS